MSNEEWTKEVFSKGIRILLLDISTAEGSEGEKICVFYLVSLPDVTPEFEKRGIGRRLRDKMLE